MKKTATSTDRQLKLMLLHRACLGGLLLRQTPKTISAAIGRDATDEDRTALYSVLSKIRCSQDELAPFQRRLGMDTMLDLQAVQRYDSVQGFVLDGYEAKILAAFLRGWLRTEAALGDMDWAEVIIGQCS